MKSLLKGIVVGILFIVGIVACSPVAGTVFSNTVANFNSIDEPQNSQSVPATPRPSATNAPTTSTSGENSADTPQIERVILRDATYTIQVADVEARIAQTTALSSEFRGWIVSSNRQTRNINGENYIFATVAIRVPAASFDVAIERIRTDAEIINEVISGRDVTREVVDLNSRVANLRVAEDQLQRFLENTATTEDLLDVFDELTSVRGEIETIEGQIAFFSESAAYSLITVNIQPEVAEREILGTTNEWSPGGTIQAALQVLTIGLQLMVDLVIVLVIVILPFGVLFGAIFVGARAIRNRLKPPKAG